MWYIKKEGNAIMVYNDPRNNAPSHVDYPIRYSTGVIAYEFPERIPEYVKEAVYYYYNGMLGNIAKVEP